MQIKHHTNNKNAVFAINTSIELLISYIKNIAIQIACLRKSFLYCMQLLFIKKRNILDFAQEI